VDITQRVSVIETSLSRQLAWIAAADAKSGFVFAVATAMLGLLAATAPPFGGWTPLGVSLGVVTAVLLLGSLAGALAAVFPRTKGPRISVIFFGGITSRNVDAFRSDVHSLSEETYEEDLIQQCYVNAVIAGSKYHKVKIAAYLLVAAVVPWAATAYVFVRDKAGA
jgi:hypothetical protein